MVHWNEHTKDDWGGKEGEGGKGGRKGGYEFYSTVVSFLSFVSAVAHKVPLLDVNSWTFSVKVAEFEVEGEVWGGGGMSPGPHT